MKRVVIILCLTGAVALVVAVALPPRARALAVSPDVAPGIRGAFHIHTRRSDGSGTPDEIAAAAARAGLKFIILTDHETAASEPTRPYYRNGVLVLEGVEISSDDGHVVAVGLPRSPYPLGGEARDVIEDVARMGGMTIAAHPGSPKADLQWDAWDEPFDGIEWVNIDSEWRDESALSLLGAPFTYAFRRAETLARLLDRPEPVLQRWDALTVRRRVVAIAASDAHARVGLRSGEPDDPLLGVHLPSYEAIFRTLSVTIAAGSFTGEADADARVVLDAIRRGHLHSTIDAMAAPAAFSFTASSGSHRFAAGDIVGRTGDRIEFQIDSNAPGDARIVLLKNGKEEASATGARLRHVAAREPATYRAEVHLTEAPGRPPVPWVLSNPIYVGLNDAVPSLPRQLSEVVSRYDNGPAAEWMAASSPRSRAVLDVVPGPGGTQLSLRFGLGGTMAESPYAALVMPAGTMQGYDRLIFTARASQPMRLSVQVRAPTTAEGERWHRSVYLDERARQVTIFFDDMRPRGPTSQRRPDVAAVHAVLFVVDTVNTKPGASGQIWIDEVKYGR
jgi:hypothetical protein